ncbi:MAG: pyruvate kinase [Patescibacteria group bacterium]|nr:pyruvate kinase [Patescibacteria group bacterium]
MPKIPKRTKIVCTIGPASSSSQVLGDLMDAGMNIARLNFSHGTYAEHKKMMNRIHAEASVRKLPIGIMQDLQGPKIRVGDISKNGIELKSGHDIILSTSAKPAKGKIPVTYANLHKDAKAGQKILLDDGLMDMKVAKVSGRDVHCVVITGGLLLPHKGINLPETNVSASSLSDKDKKDAYFGVKNDVDFIALSFVRSAKDIIDLRYLIKKYEKQLKKKPSSDIRIIAKIEKREAVECIDDIIEAADGIMVARGDLGIETPAEDVPLVQKMLIDKSRAAAKPVIVATQMLDSMIRNPRPTRAEVSDVANAVIDHTDAIMLSGETASGKYPVETVATMARIASRTEASKFDDVPAPIIRVYETEEDAMSSVGTILARSTDAKIILVASLSGSAGRIVSRYRPELPIFVSTNKERVYRQLGASWGVIPFMLPTCASIEELIERATAYLLQNKLVKKSDNIIVVAGEPVGVSGHINFVEIRRVGGVA